MSEEAIDLLAATVVFALALHAYARRLSVVSLAYTTDDEGIEKNAS